MARSKKSQYTKKENRTIYILLNPLSNEFYIGHCKSTLIKDVFKQHYYGERFYTKESFYNLKKQGLHPCLFLLENIYSSKVEAYKHVIVWTKIFLENGYTSLNQGNILDYINSLHDKNIVLYNDRKEIAINDICNCEICKVSNYGRKKCHLFKGDKNEK